VVVASSPVGCRDARLRTPHRWRPGHGPGEV